MILDAGITRPVIMDPANVDALAENLEGLAVAPRRAAPPPSKRLLDQLRRRNIAVPSLAGLTRDWWYDTLANNEMTAFLPSIFDASTLSWNPYSINTLVKTKKWQILIAANARADYEFSLIFLQGLSVDLIDFLSEYFGNEALKLVQLNCYFRDTCHAELKTLHIVIHTFWSSVFPDRFVDQRGLKSFSGLKSLRVNLENLSFEFDALSALSKLPSLTSLDLTTLFFKGWELTDLSALLQNPRLERVRLIGKMRQMDISALGAHRSLISLDLSHAKKITGAAALRSCSCLKSLTLGAWPDTHLDALEACAASLTSLDLGGEMPAYSWSLRPYIMSLADLGVLRSCAALTSLQLQHCVDLTDLSPLRSCTALTLLMLKGASILTDLSALGSCAALTSVNLASCEILTDLSSLRSCAALTSLNLNNCRRGVTDLSSLQYCNALLRLNLARSGHPDLNSLQHCVSLTTLDCRDCNMISVSALENCTALRYLSLRYCRELQYCSVVASLPSLTWLDVSYCGNLEDEEELYELSRGKEFDICVPNCRIIHINDQKRRWLSDVEWRTLFAKIYNEERRFLSNQCDHQYRFLCPEIP